MKNEEFLLDEIERLRNVIKKLENEISEQDITIKDLMDENRELFWKINENSSIF